MVPRQFVALLRRKREHDYRQEFGPAIICQAIHNFAGQKTPYPTFMPSWEETKTSEVPWQELLAKTRVLHAAYGGSN